MRCTKKILTQFSLLTMVLAMTVGCFAKGNVLIYTKNGKGFVHKNIPASIVSLKKICKDNGWDCVASEDPAIFTVDKINKFDVLVFSNTNNNVFDTPAQHDAFKQYIQQGGGFVGIHSACGTERDWPWFWENLGGKFVRHSPGLQTFKLKVVDPKHPSTAHLGESWAFTDECYYLNHMNPSNHVLLASDLRDLKDKGKGKYPGDIFGNYFPNTWCHEFDGGRQWFTALGHAKEAYSDPKFTKLLEGGIRWAMDEKKVVVLNSGNLNASSKTKQEVATK